MNEQNSERMSTADLAASADRNRDSRLGGGYDTDQQNNLDSTNREGVSDRSDDSTRTPLFPSTQTEQFRSRWTSIQSAFVDEPRQAVESADSLIAEVMNALARSFADERQNLERQWDRGGDVSTEDLRLGLQRYRSFFDRLLSV